MDWSHSSIPPMRQEARFGDRVVPAFAERPASIWAMVADAAARNPGGEAIICGDARLTWREVAAQSADIAAGFAKLGLKSGDRIAVLLGNRVEFVLTLFAAAHAGLVTVLLSVRQQKPEIAYVLTDCGASLLVHEADLAERLPDARDVPDLKHRIAVDDDAARSAFSSLRGNASVPAPASVGEEDTAMILYTSGTTGKPKGAMLAHCNVIHSSFVFVSCLKLTAADRSIAAVPLGHVTGVVANITTMACCAGTLIVMPEFKAGEYLKLAARERVSYTVMVPAMYNLCLLQPDFDRYDLSSWRIGGFGGAPMPKAERPQMPDRMPDHTERIQTSPRAALIYRLSGDTNPLHADYDVARKAGYPQPILHGLASYGTACAVILRAFCGGDPARMKSLDLRFAGVVMPADALDFACWKDGSRVLFEVRVGNRTVIDQGVSEVA